MKVITASDVYDRIASAESLLAAKLNENNRLLELLIQGSISARESLASIEHFHTYLEGGLPSGALDEPESVASISYVERTVSGLSHASLIVEAAKIKRKLTSGIVVLASPNVGVCVGLTEDIVETFDAIKLIGLATEISGNSHHATICMATTPTENTVLTMIKAKALEIATNNGLEIDMATHQL